MIVVGVRRTAGVRTGTSIRAVGWLTIEKPHCVRTILKIFGRNLAARKHDVHFAFGAFQQSRGFVSRQTTETDRITQSVKFDSIKECFNEG